MYSFAELARTAPGASKAGQGGKQASGGGGGGGGVGVTAPSKLHPSVKSLVRLIFDEDTLLNAMQVMNVNTDELSLDDLSLERLHR